MSKGLGYADAIRLPGGGASENVTGLDEVTGGVLLGASVAVPALLGWFEARAEFAQLCQELVRSFAGHRSGLSRRSRTQRLAAAHGGCPASTDRADGLPGYLPRRGQLAGARGPATWPACRFPLPDRRAGRGGRRLPVLTQPSSSGPWSSRSIRGCWSPPSHSMTSPPTTRPRSRWPPPGPALGVCHARPRLVHRGWPVPAGCGTLNLTASVDDFRPGERALSAGVIGADGAL